jgi:hypothetical protein
MSPKILFPLFTLAVLLTACSKADVVLEPEVPAAQPPKAWTSSVGSMGYSSSEASIYAPEEVLEE